MKLKICGMKYNTMEVAALQPDYLGFIFYEGSPRNFEAEEISKVPNGIKKVGVFVDAPINLIIEKVIKFQLDVVQLHGDETASYCKSLKAKCKVERNRNLLPNHEELNYTLPEIWNVFSIKNTFNFNELKPYGNFVDAFLFDTKGKEKGGNGYTFNWEVLKNYPSEKPFILSGGIGLEEISAIKEILKTNLPILAIDVNSKFEEKPGLKNIAKLKNFIERINNEH